MTEDDYVEIKGLNGDGRGEGGEEVVGSLPKMNGYEKALRKPTKLISAFDLKKKKVRTELLCLDEQHCFQRQ